MTTQTVWTIIIIGAVIGLYDYFFLDLKDKTTFSQHIQRWLPRRIDNIIFFALAGIGWAFVSGWVGISGERGFLLILYGILIAHFFLEQPKDG